MRGGICRGIRLGWKGVNVYAYADSDPISKIDSDAYNPATLLRIYLKHAAKCDLIHRSYKELEANCRKCSSECDPNETAANCACWAGVAQLRKTTLDRNVTMYY